jgi:hypothetical protein
MLEAGAAKGWDLRFEVRRSRSGASQDRHEDVVRLDFMAPHRHFLVDVTITSPSTNINVPHIATRLPLPGSLALAAQHGKLDADLPTSASLGTPSVYQSVHEYYPFALEDGGRLAPMAVELVDRMAIFYGISSLPCHGCYGLSLLRSNHYVRMQQLVRRSTCVNWGLS